MLKGILTLILLVPLKCTSTEIIAQASAPSAGDHHRSPDAFRGKTALSQSPFFFGGSILTWLRRNESGQEDHGHSHDDQLPNREMKIDKQGGINVPSDMKLRDEVLPKGRYLVKHRVDAGEHWFSFVAVARSTNEGEPVKPIDAKATVIRAQDQIRNSIVYAIPDGHDYRIVKLQLAGESTEYLF